MADDEQQTDTGDSDVVAYLRERDARRRHNTVWAVIIAIVLVTAGWTWHNYQQSRAEERQQDQEISNRMYCAVNPQDC